MGNKEERRISLDIEDFKTLISGGIVERQDMNGLVIKIALQDIGWDTMIHLIKTVEDES